MKQKLFPIIEVESFKARFERYLSTNDHRPNFIKRNLYNALNWNVVAVLDRPIFDQEIIERTYHYTDKHMVVDKKLELFAKIKALFPQADLKEQAKRWIIGMNEVTNDGEIAYANEAASEAPAANEDFFATAASRIQLANPASQNSILATDTWAEFDLAADAIAGSNKVYDATYPNRDDSDGDNTGAGIDIVSFLTSYTTGDFNDGGTTIKNFAILDNSSPTDPDLLLTHGQIAAFNKTATDTLKFFINHEMRRV